MIFIPNQYYYPCYTYNSFQPFYQFNQVNTMRMEATPRSRFTKEEDDLLKKLADSQEQPDWNLIARHMKNRTGRQCRERYNNYLRPNLVNGAWTSEENDLLLKLYDKFGPKWSLISQSFGSRSPVNIKNHHSSLVNQSAVKIRINRINENNCQNVKTDENINQNAGLKKVNEEENELKTELMTACQKTNKNEHYYFEISNEDLWSNNFAPSLDNDILAF